MIASVIIYVGGILTGIALTLGYLHEKEASRREALRGNPPIRDRR